MKKNSIKYVLIIICLFLILCFLIWLVSSNYTLSNDSVKNSDIFISEIVAVNQTIIMDEDNDYSDYIEIYNNSDKDINLEGYFLTDELTSSKKWCFPKLIIKPNEYLIIYASGKDKCDLSKRICHTNFKLNKDGETVSLLNSKGKIISKVKYSNVNPDESFSYLDNDYKITIGTPERENILEQVVITKEKDITINEVVSIENEAIELKNNTDKDIDLKYYSIGDKTGVKASLKGLVIKANSYVVIYGSDNYSYANNKLYTGFRIGSSNEIIYLYKNNLVVDEFQIGRLTKGISKGIYDGKYVLFNKTTLGGENSKDYSLGYTNEPVFLNNGGYVDSKTKIKLVSEDGADIFYTTDGSMPTRNSKKYSGEITINNTTVIRAIAYKEGYLPSEVVSRTYFVGRKHDLPVVSISTNNNNLYGKNGIFSMGSGASLYYPYMGANFWKDIEVPISFEFYEDGELGLNFNAGMEIYGNWSRGEAQKSLDIILREEYGLSEITYPFFENNITTFGGLLLRNSGQDYGRTKLKDAFLHKVVKGQMDIDAQDYKATVVYINGQYYGIYNIREKTNKQYIENHYNSKNKNIDLIRSKKTLLEGSLVEYDNLLNYIKNNDMTTEEAYKYLDSQIDLQELINYFVVETYIGNTDPGNLKLYKIEGGKWRWILFDLDNAFHISPSNSNYTPAIRWELPFSDYVPGHSYTIDSTIMKNIIKNSKIREMYIKTWSQHLKTTFKPDRMNGILDSMVKEIETEMPYHIKRWYSESIQTSQFTIYSMNNWKNNISKLKKVIIDRYNYVTNNIQKGLKLTNDEYNKYFDWIQR